MAAGDLMRPSDPDELAVHLAAVEARTIRERRAQGLPDFIEDEVVLDQCAAIIRNAHRQNARKGGCQS